MAYLRRCGWLLFVGFVVLFQLLAQPASRATENHRRFRYAADNFSVTLPDNWVEIDARVLAQVPAAMKRLAPNAPEIIVKYGFKAGNSAFPWIGIVISDDHLTDDTFADLSGAYRSVDRYLDHWLDPRAGGTIQKAHISNLFYDKARHVLWGMSKSTFSNIGDLQTLSAAYVTKVGAIQFHCYSTAAEYQKYQPIFRQIIETVSIDESVALR